jgi:hypothetical protein
LFIFYANPPNSFWLIFVVILSILMRRGVSNSGPNTSNLGKSLSFWNICIKTFVMDVEHKQLEERERKRS